MMRMTSQTILAFFLFWCCYSMPVSLAEHSSVQRWIASIEAEDILFASSQSSVAETSREQLNVVSAKLAQLYGDFVIEVTGHSDDQGDADNNLRLSHLRAFSVAKYLSQKNLHHHRFMVQSKGEFQPTVSNRTEQGRAQNRRVEIRVIAAGPDAISLITDPSAETEEFSLLAEAPVEEFAEVLSDEQAVDDTSLAQDEAAVDEVEESSEVVEPVAAPATVDEVSQAETKYKASDYFVTDQNKSKWKNHSYDQRKKDGTGTAYVYAGPMWNRLAHLDDRGQTSENQLSRASLLSGLGWTSFVEDTSDVYVTLEGFAYYERFGASVASGFGSSQNQWIYGGHVAIGTFLVPNWSVAARVGFGREAYLRTNGVNLSYASDFIGNIGVDSEWVVWRFSVKGDLGLQAGLSYYNVPLGDLDSGWQYGGAIFVDYDHYRVTFDYRYFDLDASNEATTYGRFSTYLSFYF